MCMLKPCLPWDLRQHLTAFSGTPLLSPGRDKVNVATISIIILFRVTIYTSPAPAIYSATCLLTYKG